MKKEILQLHISNGLSINKIAIAEDVTTSKVRHWIKKYDLKTTNKSFKEGYTKVKNYLCTCGETDPAKFYGKRKNICKQCFNAETIAKQKATKEYCVDLLGGKCFHCGYSKSLAALQFHHIDPLIKDKQFINMRGWSKECLQKELSTCILLCANCHAEEHERLRKDYTLPS